MPTMGNQNMSVPNESDIPNQLAEVPVCRSDGIRGKTGIHRDDDCMHERRILRFVIQNAFSSTVAASFLPLYSSTSSQCMIVDH